MVLDQVGLLDPACDGAQDHDLTLRVSECARHIHHVPKILYHWRVSAGSTAGGMRTAKPYATLPASVLSRTTRPPRPFGDGRSGEKACNVSG
ncbi:MAG: hypothetical protein ACLT98_05315 [Eggerthellaceae bacterium]